MPSHPQRRGTDRRIAAAAALLAAALALAPAARAQDLGVAVDGVAEKLNAVLRSSGATTRVILGKCGAQVRATCGYDVNRFLAFTAVGAQPKGPAEALHIVFGGPGVTDGASEDLLIFLSAALASFAPASDGRERASLIAALIDDARDGRPSRPDGWRGLGRIQARASSPPQSGLWIEIRPRP